MSGEEISFYDRDKKAHINILAKNTLGVSTLAIKDNNDKNCITLSAGPDGPYISITDNEEGKEVILSIDFIGTLSAIEISSGKR
jgi:hypothetical protein